VAAPRTIQEYKKQVGLDRPTSSVTSVSRKGNTMNYFENREDAARYVSDRLLSLKPGSQLTTTINHWKSGVYSVLTATDTLSGDTPIQTYSTRQQNT
jgi:hypothetical protein